MTRLTFIPPQFIKVAIAHRSDLSQCVIGGVWIAPGTTEGRVRAWKVNLPAFTNAGEIPLTNAAGKDDSVAFAILDDGGLLVVIDEAAPGGGGATSQPDAQIVPGVFPAAPPVASGTIDAVAHAQIAQVRSHLRATP